MAGRRFKLQGRLRKTLQSRDPLMTPGSAPEKNQQLSTIARPTSMMRRCHPHFPHCGFCQQSAGKGDLTLKSNARVLKYLPG